ncbi:MAG: hypothetical protein HYR63_13115 [Proteobacteria bacterium]|nr:hypothetical protein [Pseudomonadota bacterium]MBI3496963.1 hypothetical protein [Pseudomonadota bacterium]
MGKLRFNGGSDQGPDIHLGQLLADARLKLGPDVLAFASVRYEPKQKTAIDILEAYGRYQPISTPSTLWSIKLGAFFPPISLENEGVGWTSPWTLTPSAINSWVGDELRTIGGESTLEWRYGTGAFGITGAVFGKNDPTGALLADRGWTFGDRPTGLFDRLRIPDVVLRAQRRRAPGWMSEFREIDNTPGFYGGLSWRENDIGRLTLLHYDNGADPAARRYGQFAWRTEFNSAGIETYLGDFVVLSQGMVGETEINPSQASRSITHFQSAYLLAGRYFGNWNAALRLDVFATQERSGPNNDYTEHGHALTLAVTWGPVRWFKLSGEVLRIDSSRVQRSRELGLPQRSVETQLQLNARFVY